MPRLYNAMGIMPISPFMATNALLIPLLKYGILPLYGIEQTGYA